MNKTRGLQNIYVSTRNIYTVEKIKNQSDATISLHINVQPPKGKKTLNYQIAADKIKNICSATVLNECKLKQALI